MFLGGVLQGDLKSLKGVWGKPFYRKFPLKVFFSILLMAASDPGGLFC